MRQKQFPHFCGIYFPMAYAESKDVDKHVCWFYMEMKLLQLSFKLRTMQKQLNNIIFSYVRKNSVNFNKVVSDIYINDSLNIVYKWVFTKPNNSLRKNWVPIPHKGFE